MRGDPSDFWGKLEQDEDGKVLAWHPVEWHCAEVAACCEALLRDTLLGARLARLIGQDELDPRLRDRLTVLAVLHDLGKYTISFQNRPYPDRQPQGGHIEPIVLALSHDGALKDRIVSLLSPLEAFGEPWGNYLLASISHHGRPERIRLDPFDPKVFAPARGLDPLAGMARLFALAQRWCPRAFEPGGSLPTSAAVEHFFAGLVMLGDWLGSDKAVFPFTDDLTADPMPRARERAARLVRDRFLSVDALRPPARIDFGVFGSSFEPRPAQSVLDSLPLPPTDRGSLTVLEAETGSGKTEAAIHRFAQLFRAGLVDGLYFALPTRTSATQIHERVRRAVEATFDSLEATARPPVVLAVPGYLRVDDEEGRPLPKFEFLWPDKGKDRHRTWAAENSKRYLAGSVVVGTIDQVLLSTLVVSHAHLRATSLSRLFLVVDEVHASDTYMTALLDRVLAFHLAMGGHALLMSATLGTAAQARFFGRLQQKDLLGPARRPDIPPLATASVRPYPAITTAATGEQAQGHGVESPSVAKECSIELAPEIEEPALVARHALEAALAGAQVLVLRNTVADAVATQRALESIALDHEELLFRVEGRITLHHARFTGEDRKKLDAAVEARLGKDAPRTAGSIVVATQTVQQSLDLDADLLITDLCPMDVLLQRIGRLHRHARDHRPAGFTEARCVLLDPGPLAALLRDDGELRSQHGFGSVYEDLRVLEATRDVCLAHPLLAIPKHNRWLVEQTTHPEALAAVVRRGGPSFEAHARKVDVSAIVHRQMADLHVVDRQKHFGEHAFPDRETSGRIATRLGESDRLIELEAPFRSPFGSWVRQLKIPHWMARDVPAETRASARALDGTAEIRVSDAEGNPCASFVYDRLGLRAASEEESDADE